MSKFYYNMVLPADVPAIILDQIPALVDEAAKVTPGTRAEVIWRKNSKSSGTCVGYEVALSSGGLIRFNVKGKLVK